jgi:hypothetical protein
MIKSDLLSLTVLVLFLGLNCKKDEVPCTTCPPPPPSNCVYPAGNRNFTWRLDTVAWWPSEVGGVWAFSDSDAWVMGNMHGPTVPGQTSYLGLHWDGLQWGTPASYDQVQHLSNDVIGDGHYMVSVGYWSVGNEKVGLAEFDNRTKQWTGFQFQTQGELRSVWTDGSGYFIAVGDNGMVYTKDGYAAGWVFSQAPTTFNFTEIVGISKDEMYARAGVSLANGAFYQQIWRYAHNIWTKLMDNQDTTGTPIRIPEAGDEVYEVAACRCQITDSLYLYIVGRESFELTAKGGSLLFGKENLASKGLPSSQQAAGFINLFSPNDYWTSGLRYQLYHWNGMNFQKIEPIPTLPYGQLWGVVSGIHKHRSGKTWMVLEMSSQVYAVLQGVP